MNTTTRLTTPTVLFSVFLTALGAGVSETGAGILRKGSECAADRVFLEDVSIRRKKGVESETLKAEFTTRLEQALQKKGLAPAADRADLRDGDVTLRVDLRAWLSRTPNGRAIQELAATIRVRDADGKSLWSGEVNPGGASRLMHFKHADPKNLARKTAGLLADACRHDWKSPVR